ncbi:hypothetical protein ACFLSA_01440 [Bacteroidota bacterium]
MNAVKRITSYILIGLVIIFTVISILGIWEVISLEDIIRKILLSLFVVFVAAVVVLFIFSVLIKDPDKSEEEE